MVDVNVNGEMNIIPVIICGGAGTRLWPVSREAFPKPLLKLADGESLLQKTLKRAARVVKGGEVVIVTNRETYFLTKDECVETGLEARPQLGFVLEPVGRNTAAAIGVAAETISARYGEDAVMLVLPADQLIDDEDAFVDAVEHAVAAAQRGRLVTFGIRPTRPETGYGYIEYDEVEGPDKRVRKVSRFVEKPDLEQARALVADGRHLWNAGMFCFTANTLLTELERHAPAVYQPVAEAVQEATVSNAEDGFMLELGKEHFSRAENISIDYAVMERSTIVDVVPCELGWSDIGSWQAISVLTPADAQGNRIDGRVELHDSQNCFVRGGDRLVGLVGLRDIIVIDTPDALLVAAGDRSQDVKHIVAKLKRSNDDTFRLHRTVHRPWGTYTVLEEGDRFKMKRIVVKPGASLSLQMHHHRSEHWIVVRGCAEVVNGDHSVLLQPNESTYIPAGHRHRLVNPGVVDLVLIEVQCGEYLGEDDIVRFADEYGRVAS